jgi:hypothetical protein
MLAKVSVLIACLLMCTATVMSEAEFVAEIDQEIDSTGEVEVAMDSIKNIVESSPEFQAFLSKITTAGYFKDFKQGTDDYKAAYDKALSKFTQEQAKKQAKKAEDTEAMLEYARKHMQEESENKKVAEEKQKKKDECTCKKVFLEWGALSEYDWWMQLILFLPELFYSFSAFPLQMAVCFFQVPVFSCVFVDEGWIITLLGMPVLIVIYFVVFFLSSVLAVFLNSWFVFLVVFALSGGFKYKIRGVIIGVIMFILEAAFFYIWVTVVHTKVTLK